MQLIHQTTPNIRPMIVSFTAKEAVLLYALLGADGESLFNTLTRSDSFDRIPDDVDASIEIDQLAENFCHLYNVNQNKN